jgi:CPA2 family monovalent cation:H+ antiporter-2
MAAVVDATRLLELGAVILGLAVLARLAGRVGIPPIPLYLLAGLAFGQGGLLPLITTHEFVETGSELGLILLLFMLGLEHSAKELVTTMKGSVGAGVLDLLVNGLPGFAAGLILGLGLIPAMFLAGVTLVSSSSIAAKILADLRWSGHVEARFVVSILVMEDLAMAVYLPILAAVVVGGAGLAGVGVAALAVAAVGLVLLVALRVEVGLSRLVFSHSDEVLLLTILGTAVLVAGLAELIQVSAAVGALLVGIALSGPAAKGARAVLSPLRDLFAALFFAFIGLSVDPASLLPTALPAVVLAVVGVGSKLLTGWWGARQWGMDRTARAHAGVALMARGEFSLVIAGLAVASGLEPRLASITVGYVILLAVAAPLLARLADTVLAHAGRPEGSDRPPKGKSDLVDRI